MKADHRQVPARIQFYTKTYSFHLDTNGCGENGGFPDFDNGKRGPSGQNSCGLICTYLLAKDFIPKKRWLLLVKLFTNQSPAQKCSRSVTA